jgi:hypothetical protein
LINELRLVALLNHYPLKIHIAALQLGKLILLEWKLAGLATDAPCLTRTHTALNRDKALSDSLLAMSRLIIYCSMQFYTMQAVYAVILFLGEASRYFRG